MGFRLDASGPRDALPSIGVALRRSLADGYGPARFRRDAMAGLVVGVIALPLSMALAIAVGVPPHHGLATAIVGGFLVALLGGSRTQVSGPTAAFVVVLAPIVAHFGVGGLLLAGAMAGVILALMGLFRMGRLVEFIPYPVTTGFTAGIAIVIGTLQLRDLLGLTVTDMPPHFAEKAVALARALPTARGAEIAVGGATLLGLLLWPRLTRRVPAALVVLPAVALGAWALRLEVDTLATRFAWSLPDGTSGRGIPRLVPWFSWPWSWGGPDGAALRPSWALVRDLVPAATAIAVLGAIESLLSAVIADGVRHDRHDPDAELLAQGLGNVACAFTGGIAATGAIARTAANIRSGATSPVAAMVHAGFVLVAMLALAPLLGHLPMASMAALLLVVAWNMSERRHVVHVLRVGPRSDVLVLLTCLALTVLFDMVIAVGVGTMLAALLFMKRMADLATVRLVAEPSPDAPNGAPPGVLVYAIDGPLFFGAAQRAMAMLRTVDASARVVVLDLRAVPMLDATGLANLESAEMRLAEAGVRVLLAGVQAQPRRVLAQSRLGGRGAEPSVHETMADALAEASRIVGAA